MAAELKGAAELIATLKSMGAKMERSGVRGAARAGIMPAVKLARSRVPVRTGTLKKNIVGTRSRRDSRLGAIEVIGLHAKTKKKVYANTARNRRSGRVGRKYTVQGEAFYWRFLEFGTRRGIAARHYLEHAFRDAKSAMLSASVDYLRKFIQRQTK